MKLLVTRHEDAVAAIGETRHGAVTAPLLDEAGVPPHVAQYLRIRGLLVSVGVVSIASAIIHSTWRADVS